MQLIGKTLGKYRITQHLGSGGMSEVYKSYQPGLDRYVAIKVLHSFLADEEDFLTRFRREAKLAAMLRHPNIIQVIDFDYDEQDKAYYMVMEYVEGASLKVRLQKMAQKGETMPLDEAMRIVTAIGSALDYAHQYGTVHRDVKPANIMFTKDDQPILTDFGIAKMVNVVGLTASGAMVGTPAYMSPEQGMGQAGDERSDIYSLGVVLYQLATGQRPFEADTPLGIALKHISAPLPLPSTINPDLPPSIEAVIVRALAKSPDDRYQSAKEFVTDLKRAAAGAVIEPPPLEVVVPLASRDASSAAQDQQWDRATLPGAPAVRPLADAVPPTGPPAARRRRWWPVALVGVLILVAAGVCATLFATGRAQSLIAAARSQIVGQVATPTATVEGTPTATPDAIATQSAMMDVLLATRYAHETAEAIRNATATPTQTPTPDATATYIAGCEFDLEVIANPAVWPAILMPGQQFIKRWTVENTGTCSWPERVQLALESGDDLQIVEEPDIAQLQEVAPDSSVEVAVTLKAPTEYGTYTAAWQLQDNTGMPIGQQLQVVCRVGATATPPPTATPEATPTPTEPLWMSVPGVITCNKKKTRADIAWGAGGGPSNDRRFFFSSVATDFELLGSYREIDLPHAETYFTTSGSLVLPVPDGCCTGDYGRYVAPEGYEIVWQKVFFSAGNCP